MAIFNSYVKLPEGRGMDIHQSRLFWCLAMFSYQGCDPARTHRIAGIAIYIKNQDFDRVSETGTEKGKSLVKNDKVGTTCMAFIR